MSPKIYAERMRSIWERRGAAAAEIRGEGRGILMCSGDLKIKSPAAAFEMQSAPLQRLGAGGAATPTALVVALAPLLFEIWEK